ncbi:hypothetical protein HK098_001652 [Nowakowskiella sp. JEL0407]|nr:hypothetical protein HK098_001652 [Nowakowskiella sp. JEL0407]
MRNVKNCKVLKHFEWHYDSFNTATLTLFENIQPEDRFPQSLSLLPSRVSRSSVPDFSARLTDVRSMQVTSRWADNNFAKFVSILLGGLSGSHSLKNLHVDICSKENVEDLRTILKTSPNLHRLELGFQLIDVPPVNYALWNDIVNAKITTLTLSAKPEHFQYLISINSTIV